jgi:hypothetical protein
LIDHVVQLYDETDEQALVGAVAPYLAEALRSGEGALVVGTSEHNAAFVQRLIDDGLDAGAAVRDGRLVVLNAREMLACFMAGGQPNRERFDETIGATIRELCARGGGNSLRAYGEMVGVLWRDGQYAAAIRLEALWNELLRERRFKLFCAYPIDVLGDEFHADDVDALLCAHTHLLPAAHDLAETVDEALDEVLGTAVAASLRIAMRAGEPSASAALPRGEATILWLRKHLPDYAPEIIARARTRCRPAA